MLLIWGFKVRFKALRSVLFACPQCGADREGVLRQARRWFTFFFVPLIPLAELGRDVECSSCHRRFDPRILENPTSATISANLESATRFGVAAIVRAHSNRPATRVAAIAAMREHIAEYNDAQLDIDLANTNDTQLESWLRHLADALNPHGKEAYFNAMARIALADGPLDDNGRALLTAIGNALMMTQAQITGLFATLEQPASN
jgi:Tellurite resistance protein TerB